MRATRRWRIGLAPLAAPLLVACVTAAPAGITEEEVVAQKVAAIKQSLRSSALVLKRYEWIETVTVAVDGERRSRRQNRCYHGADGKRQKVPIGEPEEAERPFGLRGRIAKKKMKAMEQYLQEAMALIEQYVPPNADRLQAIKDQGLQTLEVRDNATRLRAIFPDYLKKGDSVAIDVDPNADRVRRIAVATYMGDDLEDAVQLVVDFGTFEDGTSYPARIDLHGASKQVDVGIENSGYREVDD